MDPSSPPPYPNEDRGPALIAILWTLTAVTGVIVTVRHYCRVMIRTVGWDDYFMYITFLLFLGWTIVATIFAANGGETHLYYLAQRGPGAISYVVKLIWVTQVFGIMGIGTGKISVAILILRIMGPNKDWRKWFLYYAIGSLTVVCTLCSILIFTQCRPARRLWDQSVPGTCWAPDVLTSYGIFTGSYNAFLDVVLAVFPITIFWGLQMAMYKRIGLCVLFSMGVFAGICAAYKTSKLPSLSDRSDFTWATYDIFAWVTAELFLIILCGSIPAMKPLYERILGRRSRSSGASSGYNSGSNSKYNRRSYYQKQTDSENNSTGMRGMGKNNEHGTYNGNSTKVASDVWSRGASFSEARPGDQSIKVENTVHVGYGNKQSVERLV